MWRRWLHGVRECWQRCFGRPRRPAGQLTYRPVCEQLEDRCVPSAGGVLNQLLAHPMLTPATAVHLSRPSSGQGPGGGYTPDQIRTAYNFYGITDPLTGSPFGSAAVYNQDAGKGMTIAIVDAYNDPYVASDLHTFDSYFGLPDPPAFVVENEYGGSSLPATDSSWATEIALDVEWAHAIAPAARILLVEATSARLSDLLTAVQTAAQQAQVVSMSWGGSEFKGETHYDYLFNVPGVTFVASSGDAGPPPLWPAVSPYVVAVGGTTLTLNSDNTWASETGWGYGSWSWFFGGSGGGISRYESQPFYQKGVVSTWSTTRRTSPDVAYVADPHTGVSIYDSIGSGGWTVVGGTSVGAPQWSALIALADQGRSRQGLAPLSSVQTLTALYQLYAAPAYSTTYFHDITSGNNGYPATVGYDLVTGLGSPRSPGLLAALIAAH
jgi:subtilase family serine protease